MSFQEEIKSVQEAVESLTEDERKTMLVFEIMTSKQLATIPGEMKKVRMVHLSWRSSASKEQNDKLDQSLEKLANYFKMKIRNAVEGN